MGMEGGWGDRLLVFGNIFDGYLLVIYLSQMKVRHRQSPSLRQTSFDPKQINHTHRQDKHSTSAIYQSPNNSIHSSPRYKDKYKSYMNFINKGKITSEPYQLVKDESINREGSCVPARKNSPLPYAKIRRSVYCKSSHAQSPTNFAQTYRNSFPKSQDTKPNKKTDTSTAPNMSFVVKGNNVKSKESSSKQGNNRTGVTDKNRKNQVRSISKGEKPEKAQDSYRQDRKNGNQGPASKLANRNKVTVKDIEAKKDKSKHKDKDYNKDKEKDRKEKPATGEENGEKLEKEEAKLRESLFNGIEFYRDLGRGAHALVRSAVDWVHKRKIAVKIYEKSQLTTQQITSIQRQIQILSNLNHPSIIKLYQIIQTFKTINLIMQYGGGNSLDQYIKNKPEGYLSNQESKLIFKQVLLAVDYLHEMNITHRDIKPENILLNKHLDLKIIDFGFSLSVSGGRKISSYCGTPTYMAPEVVSKTPHNPLLADRWSLGILLFCMLNGQCPFRAPTQKQLFLKINRGEYEYVREVDPKAKDLITKLIAKVPEDRLTPKQALQHEWWAEQ